jgi:L-serine/L-threonine ammonia-lyase
LRSLGAEVRIEPRWEECNEAAVALANESPNAIYIHPFIGEDVVRGHTSVVREIMAQFPAVATRAGIDAAEPDIVCCSIGGGGLVQGIMLGLTEHAERTQSTSKHVLAICTIGADSFSRSLESEENFVTLKEAHSKALSLRCEACSPISVQFARRYASTGSVAGADESTKGKAGRYLTVVRAPDDYAGAASWQYRRDSSEHAELELGCGAALSAFAHPCPVPSHGPTDRALAS